MNNVDIGRYSKKIVQFFWDPQPKNDGASTTPIWCLGLKYESHGPDEVAKSEITSLPESVRLEGSTESMENTTTKPYAENDSMVQLSKNQTSKPDRISTYSKANTHTFQDIQAATSDSAEWPEPFLNDFESRIWLTYRSNFPPIPKSEDPKANASMSLSVRLKSQLTNQGAFTSDTGWGCMIRSGQSLLANALALLRLGRDRTAPNYELKERQLLSLFADDPRAPFSIHKFVEHGANACGTYPGQWFGPSATSRCIEALSNNFENAGLRVYVTGDGPDVFEDDLYKISKSRTEIFHPILLLVGTRLGIDRVTPVYWEALKASLQMPQSVGIAGGRPSASHYFVGNQGSDFFYLDPHQTRPALPYHERPEDYTDEEIDSCHTRRLRRLPIEEMDPSMLIGFLFRTEEDWLTWRRSVSEAPGKAIFHVADSRPLAYGMGIERKGAVDEVETLDDECYDDDSGSGEDLGKEEL